jgi:hypothetical protein
MKPRDTAVISFVFSSWIIDEFIIRILLTVDKTFYNIAFVNSERWLAKSRVDITQCQHGKFSAACKQGNFSYPSGFWHCYIIKKI